MDLRIEIFPDRNRAQVAALALTTQGWATSLAQYERMAVIDATADPARVVHAGGDRWVVTATR